MMGRSSDLASFPPGARGPVQVCALCAYVSLFFWGWGVMFCLQLNGVQRAEPSENTPVRMWWLRLSLCSAARQ